VWRIGCDGSLRISSPRFDVTVMMKACVREVIASNTNAIPTDFFVIFLSSSWRTLDDFLQNPYKLIFRQSPSHSTLYILRQSIRKHIFSVHSEGSVQTLATDPQKLKQSCPSTIHDDWGWDFSWISLRQIFPGLRSSCAQKRAYVSMWTARYCCPIFIDIIKCCDTF
jgi:hypothetical protein